MFIRKHGLAQKYTSTFINYKINNKEINYQTSINYNKSIIWSDMINIDIIDYKNIFQNVYQTKNNIKKFKFHLNQYFASDLINAMH